MVENRIAQHNYGLYVRRSWREPLVCDNAWLSHSNPNSLDFAYTYIIIAPVIEARRVRVGVPGHALRNLDTPAVRCDWLM